MFRKVIAQVDNYVTKLTKADFDNNPTKLQKEIDDLEKKYTPDKRISVNVKFDNKNYTIDKFLKLLKQQIFDLNEKKTLKSTYDSFLFHDIGGKNMDVTTTDAQNSLKRDIAALEKQIQVREQTLAEIDNYVVSLLSGEMAQLNISHTNAKFIKIAKEDMQKEADEEIENYYNELYEGSEGSPDFGTALEHPEETRNELTTKIHHHKFRKK
jgi:hypothetical protein